MIQKYFRVLILLVCGFLPAGVQAGVLLSAGANAVWQKTNDGRYYSTIFPIEARVGYSWPKYVDIYASYDRYSARSDSGDYSAMLTHEDYLVWLRRMITRTWLINPYIAMGLGAEQERVARTLGAETNYQTGDLQLLTSVAIGARYRIRKFTIDLEGRLNWSAGYQPNPMPELGSQLGFNF